MTDNDPIVILPDDAPMPRGIEDDAKLGARTMRTKRGLVRFLRSRGHRGRNAELERIAGEALAAVQANKEPGLLPAWATDAVQDAQDALRLIDAAAAMLGNVSDKLPGRKWQQVLEHLDSIDAICGWQNAKPQVNPPAKLGVKPIPPSPAPVFVWRHP